MGAVSTLMVRKKWTWKIRSQISISRHGACRYMLAHEGFLENLWGNMYVIHFLFVSTMYDVLKSWYFAFLANQKQQNSRDVLQYRLCNQGASDRFPLFQRHRWGSWQRSCKKLEVLQGGRWTSIQWDYLVCGMFTLALSVYPYMHTYIYIYNIELSACVMYTILFTFFKCSSSYWIAAKRIVENTDSQDLGRR